ncbi:MAG: hypothetical protein A3D31_12630 [Candidatus Fluviicola riflensis]|nr:MAG: hypothetical protein CHH17_17070 [Candidatus Fluviicola riflensis]OGS77829.1 MAG: hypothetical protein A3D31_12630 [Candidatus Fluviicola riflensis]OGS84894.1 MAG: hypothetical protein A2724_09565 [Fluviicola sp. RIFCSPHIGHO2_01_FULL_43_53]OGS89166.1 MAG: hypothetical protein A3E30_03870 [Fluviicola sp. RIFCSPHIGHO2_12_FULL_43_24]
MDISVFTNKAVIPGDGDLFVELKETYDLWQMIRNHVHELYPEASDEWNYSGKKFGWGFRVKDKKRVIVYLLPRESYFKVAFVFGQKATDAVMSSEIADTIKNQLQSAKVYAEGRGIRIDVRDEKILKDIKQLTEIKLTH